MITLWFSHLPCHACTKLRTIKSLPLQGMIHVINQCYQTENSGYTECHFNKGPQIDCMQPIVIIGCNNNMGTTRGNFSRGEQVKSNNQTGRYFPQSEAQVCFYFIFTHYMLLKANIIVILTVFSLGNYSRLCKPALISD